MILPLIMSSTGDMNKNWLIWKQCFLEFMEWNNYHEQPEEYKITILRSLLGYDALSDPSIHRILNYRFSTLICVLERLDVFFSNMRNELIERYNFFTRFQAENEPIEIYILDLIEKAKTCNFGNLSDSIVRDKVIASIHNKKFQSKLFQTLNLNLSKLLHICKAHEAQNKNNNGNVVEKRQTKTNALHNDKIAVVEASNNNNKKVAEGKQYSNDKVNTKMNVEAKTNPENDKGCKNIIGTTNQSDTSNKDKTDSKMHKSGSNILRTACKENNTNIGNKTNNKTNLKNDKSGNNVIDTIHRRHSDNSYKAKTDSKMHDSGSNILSTACKENHVNIVDETKTNPKNDKSGKAKTAIKMDNNGSNILSTAYKENNNNIGNKTNNKTNLKNDKNGNNVIGTIHRRHSDSSNKAKTDSKMHNSVSNILSTACKENKNNIGDKTKTDAKNGNNVSNHTDLVFGKNSNDVNDKVKIDSKSMNSNHNMNTARRSSVTSGTQYGRNCRKCNGKHAERACPAWGHKCENCGERNHFPNCCQMKPLKTTEQHINMSSIENVLNPNHFQHDNQPQPILPSNYSLVANIEPCYLPSAPVFCEMENELYPKLSHMSTSQACALRNPEATVGNTEPKTVATETQNHKKCSNPEKADTCSIS